MSQIDRSDLSTAQENLVLLYASISTSSILVPSARS